MSPRCYRTQRYTIKKNNIKRTLYFLFLVYICTYENTIYHCRNNLTHTRHYRHISSFTAYHPLFITDSRHVFPQFTTLVSLAHPAKYLGSYIRNFREHKAIPLHAKIISVSLIWITLSYCAIWTLPYIWARILFLIIAIGTTWHILSYKTLKR